jgi:hypothetical protein
MNEEIKEYFEKANAFTQLALEFAKENDREAIKKHFEWAQEQITAAQLIVWNHTEGVKEK